MAKAMGKTRDDYRKYFSSASTEEAAIKKDFQNYINTTLVPLIEQYRASGFSDKDILAMMK
jgi:DNA-binding transcriptional regulator YhcF (GntR family)